MYIDRIGLHSVGAICLPTYPFVGLLPRGSCSSTCDEPARPGPIHSPSSSASSSSSIALYLYLSRICQAPNQGTGTHCHPGCPPPLLGR
ncbi:hypothetical protein LX32DRAFT_62018 [Colletotrichum zoysiae]|uniref:Uncharacterized protein n=1 Tax=Colletotrichum zoysiae TaxID=1216348 RepID=A0AAD9HBN0_9PEZI|nr:hypothetical protein LX32DRAFT_62018 [Colletotrichum zoysiae]